MPSDRSYSFNFPKPRGATAWILTINIVCFFLTILLLRFSTSLGPLIKEVVFIPSACFSNHHFWQPLTYSFFDLDVISIAFSSLMIWQLGPLFGSRKFLEVYFTSLIAGGLVAAALSYLPFIGVVGVKPDQMISTAWPGILGLVVYRGTTRSQESCCLLGMPVSSKNMAWIWVGLEVAFLIAFGQLLYVAGLCGALTGYVYGKAMPTRGMKYAASEGYFGVRNGVRNAFYRWKRKRAARKFEVYMSKQDRTVHFDQYGNYIHPEDNPRKDDDKSGPSGWVN